MKAKKFYHLTGVQVKGLVWFAAVSVITSSLFVNCGGYKASDSLGTLNLGSAAGSASSTSGSVGSITAPPPVSSVVYPVNGVNTPAAGTGASGDAPTPPALIPVTPGTSIVTMTGYSVSPQSTTAGEFLQIQASIMATTAGSYIIDLEFHTAAGATVTKNAVTDTFTAGQTKQYLWNYIVPQSEPAGAYTAIIAAFDTTYATTYFYKEYAVNVAAGAPLLTAKPLPAGGGVAGKFAMGVNVDGMEASGNVIPGVGGTNYALIKPAEMPMYHTEGLNLIRLPLSWERMQPVINGDLNATYVTQVQAVLASAAALNMSVILDIHNYGGRSGMKLGGGTLTRENFADLWTKMATTFKGQAGIAGYDLMNEPNGMPTQTAWAVAAQAAITAIRAVDPDVTLYVEGDGYSSADRWSTINVTFPLNDPSNKTIYSGHAYADSDASGTHFVWATEAAAGVTTALLTTRISHFAAWCEAYKVPCHIGEVGVGNDDPSWNVALDMGLAFAQQHGLQVTYWAAGPFWSTTYPMQVEYTTAPQLTVLTKYSGGTIPQ